MRVKDSLILEEKVTKYYAFSFRFIENNMYTNTIHASKNFIHMTTAEDYMSVKWLDYQGKKVLYVDFRKMLEEQVIVNIELEAKMIAEAPGKVLVLANVEGAAISSLERLKQVGKKDISPKIEKSALVGITGLKEILLRAYNTFTGSKAQPFPNEKEALDWLVK